MKGPRTANQMQSARGQSRQTSEKCQIGFRMEWQMTGSSVRLCASVRLQFPSVSVHHQRLRGLTSKVSPLLTSQLISRWNTMDVGMLQTGAENSGIWGSTIYRCSVRLCFISYTHTDTQVLKSHLSKECTPHPSANHKAFITFSLWPTFRHLLSSTPSRLDISQYRLLSQLLCHFAHSPWWSSGSVGLLAHTCSRHILTTTHQFPVSMDGWLIQPVSWIFLKQFVLMMLQGPSCFIKLWDKLTPWSGSQKNIELTCSLLS